MTNDDDEANAGDAGGADKDRVGGTGGGTMRLAGRDDGSGGDVNAMPNLLLLIINFFSYFNGAAPSHMILVDCCLLCC